MAGQAASQIEIPDEWVQQFKSNVASDRKGTAPSAWKEIEEAGLAGLVCYCCGDMPGEPTAN